MVTTSSRATRPQGRPKAELSLTDEERSALDRLARRRKSAQAAALRARMVLACAKGSSNVEVAGQLDVRGALRAGEDNPGTKRRCLGTLAPTSQPIEGRALLVGQGQFGLRTPLRTRRARGGRHHRRSLPLLT